MGLVWFLIYVVRWISLKTKLRKYSYFDSKLDAFITDEFEMAFAFAGSVYVPPTFDEMVPAERSAILNHERRHVKFNHEFDKWLMNMARVILWINPIFRYLSNELSAIHEFEADDDFAPGYDRILYSELLLKLQFQKSDLPLMASPFSQSLIKKRVRQLNQPKSNTMKKGLFFLSLPMIIMLVYAFSIETVNKPHQEESQVLTPHFVSPINLSKVTRYSSFGMRKGPGSAESQMHEGLDLAAEVGTDVFASSTGTVVLVEHYSTGHGLRVGFDHADSFETRYSHLDQILVVEGQNVESGQLIGKCGTSGKSTGPHLHFEILKNEEHVDPEKFLSLSLLDFGASDLSKEKFLVIIDPAHGGKDNGVQVGDHTEKDLSLKYALTLRDELKVLGISSIILREDDRSMSLEQRTMATYGTENVLYLSLHFNESKSDSAQGIELYLSEQEDVNQLKSKLYGEIFGQLAVAKDIQFRGVKTAGFYVVKNSNSPAILMELGFMSSPEELEKILDDQYRKKVCSVIAESTNLYVN